MKPSRRNLARLEARNASRLPKPPVVSKYAAKVQRQLKSGERPQEGE